ncbi:hypothetical protein CDG60_09640 [Acinetobacter chinensis]|uniref:Uncharacterized protein n=1 Tax=Acinetobacter chinensis TaxID=2004650 RepID=A0A3B7LXV4_9GAMM|nr:tape measure protein [Acinetobacter chinensis]AXY56804.1 hypothetical protein CDG60_09640 [Acinetobacter chinensis]
MTQTSRLVIEIDSRNAERNARAVAAELENLTVKGGKAEMQMTEMSASIKSLVGYMGGILTISKAIAMADGYTQMAARIRNATASAEEYRLVQDRVLATANTTYRSLGEAQEVYLSLAGGMKSLGRSTTETLDLVDSLSFSFTHNATRTDQAQSAMDSLSKSMAKGKIDADAWISIVTGADNVIADMAKTTGKSEAEIRKLGAEGKASLEDLIKTLIATREQNEKLANNMENSLADGFTMLSNAVTVYLGKANEATSATGIMAGALGELAQNLDSVANVAMIGGVAFLTKTILAQTVAIRGSIAESLKKNSVNLSELTTNAALTASEARKTGAVAQYTAMQLADAKATAARMTGLQRLSYIQATVIPLETKATQATAAHAAATAADTIAQEANNKARSRAAALYSLIGGPIGAVTLGVTALAAGYVYFSSRAEEANKKLEEQAAVAKKAKDELLALKGLEKDGAINDMTAAFERQNKALSESSSKINMQLNAIEQLYKGNKEVVQVVQDARNGTISMTEAVQRFNELRISKDVYESIKANTAEFVKNAQEATNTSSKLKLFGIEVEVAGRNAQTAIVGVDGNTKALKENKSAANSAAEAQKSFKASLFDREFDAYLTKNLLAKGYTPEQVANMVQTANWARKNNVQLTNDLFQIGLQTLSIEQQNSKVIESRNKVLKENTKEAEKKYQYTQAELKMLQKVATLSAKHDLDGIGAKYGIPKNYLAGLMAQESKGNPDAVSPTGAIGYYQTTSAYRKDNGLSIADSKNLPVIAEVVAKNLAKAYKELGDWEAAIRSHNAGLAGSAQFAKSGKVNGGAERNKEVTNFAPAVNKWIVGLGGSALKNKGVDDAINDLKQYSEFLKEQADLQKSLELDVANEVTKIRENLKDKLKEIDKAGFSADEKNRLVAEYQSRADSEISIAEYALKTKLNDYTSFKKSEVQLLKDSFDQKKFYAAHDIELSRSQRDQAVEFLNEQYAHELGLIQLAKEQRIFQMKEQFLDETVAFEMKYDLEKRKLIEINDLQERAFKAEMLRLQKMTELQQRLNDASKNWAYAQADMLGTGDFLQIQDDRDSREKQSSELADAQVASLAQSAADPDADLEAIAAARELIWQEHHDRMKMIEFDYQMNSLQLQMSYGQSITGAVVSMLKDIGEEKSTSYKVAFAIDKAFTAAQASLAMGQNIAQASKVGFPQNLPLIAGAFAQGAQIASIISSVKAQGFATGGRIRGSGSGTSDSIPIMASNGEFMIRAASAQKIGTENLDYMNRFGELPQNTRRVGMGTVDAIRQNSLSEAKVIVQPQININVPQGYTAEQTKGSDGSVTIDIMKQAVRDEVDRYLPAQMGNPNSRVHKSIVSNTTANTKR